MSAERPPPRLLAPSASAEQAAAIAAALGRFMRATALPPGAPARAPDGWQRTAILEGIAREPHADVADPWINT